MKKQTCVGFVLCSPVALGCGTRLTWIEQKFSRPIRNWNCLQIIIQFIKYCLKTVRPVWKRWDLESQKFFFLFEIINDPQIFTFFINVYRPTKQCPRTYFNLLTYIYLYMSIYLPSSTYLRITTYVNRPTYIYLPTNVNLPSSIYLSLPIPKYEYLIAADPGAGIGLVLIMSKTISSHNSWHDRETL